MPRPPASPLTYFVELHGEPLEQLLETPQLLQLLRASGAAISMAMLDLGPARACSIRRLNRAGVPVTAWLVLSPRHGYWLNADNAHQAHQRYLELQHFTRSNQLRLEAIGLDMEPPSTDAQRVLRQGPRALAGLLRRRRSPEQLATARRRYVDLVRQIRADGLRVESYQIPLLLDERRAHSTLLQRTLGIIDLPVDREVLMLYRSMVRPSAADLLVDAYGGEAQAIAVGITGGGVPWVLELLGSRRLQLPELLHDLRRARRHTPQLYVFSLEGCVEQGLLPALCRADLLRPEPAPRALAAARLARAGLRAALRAATAWDRPAGPRKRRP